MSQFVPMAVWLCISVYSFYILGRTDVGRERTGRRLVGIASLLIAAVLAIPEDPNSFNAGDILTLVATTLGAIMLLFGLLLAYPRGKTNAARSAAEPSPDEESTPDE